MIVLKYWFFPHCGQDQRLMMEFIPFGHTLSSLFCSWVSCVSQSNVSKRENITSRLHSKKSSMHHHSCVSLLWLHAEEHGSHGATCHRWQSQKQQPDLLIINHLDERLLSVARKLNCLVKIKFSCVKQYKVF